MKSIDMNSAFSNRTPHVLALVLAVALVACGDDDNSSQETDAGHDSGAQCEARGCFVPLADFQSGSLKCPETYAAAMTEFQNTPAQCVYAFFNCGDDLRGAAYQYGFTGDNVQCYFDDSGALVGGVRTSDHGASTLSGDIPAVSCYVGPDCNDDDAGI